MNPQSFKAWAAIKNNNVVKVISMIVSVDADFNKFRSQSLEELSGLGDVKSGEVIELDGKIYFRARPTSHQNRSKRKPKLIPPLMEITKNTISKAINLS